MSRPRFVLSRTSAAPLPSPLDERAQELAHRIVAAESQPELRERLVTNLYNLRRPNPVEVCGACGSVLKRRPKVSRFAEGQRVRWTREKGSAA